VTIITIVVVIGQSLSCAFGTFVAGHDARTSLRVGMGLAQIGEFSFIIAQHEVTTDWLASLPFVHPQRIAFYGLLVCYVAFVDWAALMAAVRRRFAAIGATPRTPAAVERRPSTRGVVWVGSLLLAANVACGVFVIDSWPFGVFPRFAGIARPEYTALEVVLRQPDGATRPVGTGLRPTALQMLLGAPDEAAKLAALRDFVAAHRVELQPGESLQLFAVTRSTVPEDRDKEPLRRTLLSQLDAAP
jgi:Kef-type K+ transport system membrane component KefB